MQVRDGALKPGKPHRGFRPGFDGDASFLIGTGVSETMLYSGRAVSSLARDTGVLSKTGKVLPTASLAALYGFQDERGIAPAPIGSVKFVLSATLGKLGLLDIQVTQVEKLDGFSKAFWKLMPNLMVPGWMLKLDIGAPNL